MTGMDNILRAAIVCAATAVAMPAAGAEEHAERIAMAFRDKGMGEEQARCYGRVLSEEFSDEEAAEVARMVREAEGEEAIREGVKEGGLGHVEAFLSAETECGGR
jgi:spermidine/putrescine-binding protein